MILIYFPDVLTKVNDKSIEYKDTAVQFTRIITNVQEK